jgi:hypothetical protein
VTSSASRVPRSHSRADQRHHQYDEPRHQEIAAVIGLVEPQALDYVHRRAGAAQSLSPLPCRPDADDASDVPFNDPCPVGITAMHDELQLSIPGDDVPSEVGWNTHDAVHLVFEQELLRGRHRACHLRMKIRGELESSCQLDRLGRRLLDHDGYRHVLDVER